MADKRKLQGEVDRCLKKVGEGCEAFEDIWHKVQNATNNNQKEKYESELKKEIKKLQRLREQIKTWATSSDIKDKKSLLDNRKLIELQMERFRVVEKETKTKAYSKEGLGQANKVDPETMEKGKCRDWLNDSIGNLGIQIDQMECEIESLNVGTKKKKLDKEKVDRIEELNQNIDKHRFHTTQLEHILRLLDNQSLEVEDVNKIKDDIEYYIENNQEESDTIDLEGIYDDLDLEILMDGDVVKNYDDKDDEDSVQSSPSSSLTSTNFHSLNSPAKSNTGSPRKNSKSSTSSVASTPSLSNGTTTPSSTTAQNATSISTSNTPSKRSLFSSTSSTNHSLSSTSSTESDTITAVVTSTPMVNGFDHLPMDSNSTNTTTTTTTSDSSNISVVTSSTTSSSSSSTTTSTSPISSASTSALTSNTGGVIGSSVSLVSTATITTTALPTEEETAVQAVRNHVESLKYPGFNANTQIWRGGSSSAPGDAISSSVTSSTIASITMTNVVTATETATASTESTSLPALKPSASLPSSIASLQSNSSLPFSPTSISSKLEDHTQQSTDFASMKSSSLFGSVMNPSAIGHKLSSSDTQEVRLQPVHGVAPLGPVLLSSERLKQLKMLDTAFHHLPQRQDSERMRPYISRSAVPIASYHHHPPPPNIDSLEFFQRLSTETLFFIFYYQEGTRAQYLAAKALKKQSWRFHTKYMMWFQRHEEPKRITDEYEEGTYIFFDYEKWSQRKRDGFTFEYRYLEDKDLP